MRYFITISYDGSRYHGWQVQPNANTVQAELNKALSLILRREITTTGAGRTDTGVNASKMVAHFDALKMDAHSVRFKLNRLLPSDISVLDLSEVRPEAHARFDATSRTYHYHIYLQKNPFLRHYAACIGFPLDFEKMNLAAQELLSVKDFTSFSKVHTDTKTNNCNVTRALWTETEKGLWRFEITADRFLRNMVRAIVGTLIEVGRGRLSIDGFRDVINKKDRCAAADSVPGHALSLVDITYPEDVFQIT